MVNRDRIINEFIQLVKIDSTSLYEREMADVLKIKMIKEGISVKEDDTARKIGGNAGNLICNIRGNKNAPPILLMAHMDTVTPGIGKKPVLEGNIIKSDGTTVLGGDDVAGIVCILEAVRVLKEQKIEHGDICIVFTVAEEIGLLGAKNLDFTAISAKYGFVMDLGGEIGFVATSAPTQNTFNIKITGKAAHAGIEPEKGISAIEIAASAISKMKLGRIDDETTANIGTIKGGEATNIICENIEIQAEARSGANEKLKTQTEHMMSCFKEAAKKFGGKVVFKTENLYPAYNINDGEDIVSILKNASQKVGIELKLGQTGGGSDTNVINSCGIKAVNISVGMDNVHSVKEQINVGDLVKATGFLISIIQSIY